MKELLLYHPWYIWELVRFLAHRKLQENYNRKKFNLLRQEKCQATKTDFDFNSELSLETTYQRSFDLYHAKGRNTSSYHRPSPNSLKNNMSFFQKCYEKKCFLSLYKGYY